jgi:hypothetical protein
MNVHSNALRPISTRYKATPKARRYALTFGAAAIALALLALMSSFLVLQVIALWFALAFGGVAFAFGFIGPRAFLKRADGRLSIVSWLIFGPYYALNFLSLTLWRRFGKEEPFHEIEPNLYLGCRLYGRDESFWRDYALVAALDLTAEFSEVGFLRNARHYLCLPVLDTQPPSVEQLETGISWILRHLAERPVYVHCALGHGRSATFVVAYLLRAGKAATVPEALDKIAAIRPDIGLSLSQIVRLEEWVESALDRS